jgi:hypothetical protein
MLNKEFAKQNYLDFATRKQIAALGFIQDILDIKFNKNTMGELKVFLNTYLSKAKEKQAEEDVKYISYESAFSDLLFSESKDNVKTDSYDYSDSDYITDEYAKACYDKMMECMYKANQWDKEHPGEQI